MCKQIRNQYKINEKATSKSLSEQQWIVNEAWLLSFQYIDLFCIYSSTRKEKITERERERENLVATAEVVGVDRCNWLRDFLRVETEDICHFTIRREELEWIGVIMKRHSLPKTTAFFGFWLLYTYLFLGPSFYCLLR